MGKVKIRRNLVSGNQSQRQYSTWGVPGALLAGSVGDDRGLSDSCPLNLQPESKLCEGSVSSGTGDWPQLAISLCCSSGLGGVSRRAPGKFEK